MIRIVTYLPIENIEHRELALDPELTHENTKYNYESKELLGAINSIQWMYDEFFTIKQLKTLILESLNKNNFDEASFLCQIAHECKDYYGVIINSN